jgi:hypothetical protein
MRRVAADPEGRSTVDRAELLPGIRSFRIRHSRDESREAPVANPMERHDRGRLGSTRVAARRPAGDSHVDAAGKPIEHSRTLPL